MAGTIASDVSRVAAAAFLQAGHSGGSPSETDFQGGVGQPEW